KFDNIFLLRKTILLENSIDFKKANLERTRLIENLEKKLSRNELRELGANSIDYKERRLKRVEYYNYLIMKGQEVGLNVDEYPMLKNYLVYVGLYDTVDRSVLMEEIDDFEKAIKKDLYENESQKELGDLSRNLVAINNLFGITLTREDYEAFMNNKEKFDVRNYTDFFARISENIKDKVTLPEGIEELDSYREKMLKFFYYSFKRDEAFVRNIQYAEPGMSSIAITGGFHTENLSKLLKENDISYVSIMPTFVNEKNYENRYFAVLSGEESELENLLKPVLSQNSMMQAVDFLSSELFSKVYPGTGEPKEAEAILLGLLCEKYGKNFFDQKIEESRVTETDILVKLTTGEIISISRSALEEAINRETPSVPTISEAGENNGSKGITSNQIEAQAKKLIEMLDGLDGIENMMNVIDAFEGKSQKVLDEVLNICIKSGPNDPVTQAFRIKIISQFIYKLAHDVRSGSPNIVAIPTSAARATVDGKFLTESQRKLERAMNDYANVRIVLCNASLEGTAHYEEIADKIFNDKDQFQKDENSDGTYTYTALDPKTKITVLFNSDNSAAKKVSQIELNDYLLGKLTSKEQNNILAGIVPGSFVNAEENITDDLDKGWYTLGFIAPMGLGMCEYSRAEDNNDSRLSDIEYSVKGIMLYSIGNIEAFQGLTLKEIMKKLNSGELFLDVAKVNYNNIRDKFDAEAEVRASL
ncbi:MAG: hypothetical protein HQL29_06170, partial [Candidatus Omnitrophica bacterium]|nr:hypothetical protein [Candidatus Omnitrophota bacterium]